MASPSLLASAAAGDPGDERLAALPLPLASLGIEHRCRPEELMGEGRVFGAGLVRSLAPERDPCVECALLPLGEVLLLSGRTTPVLAREQGEGVSSFTLCHAGAPCYAEAGLCLAPEPGELLMLPRNGGTMRTGYLASLNFGLAHQRLRRTLAALQAEAAAAALERPQLFGGATAPLQAFFHVLDALLRRDRCLPAALGLEEQLHRLVALALLQSLGQLEALQRRWSSPVAWSAALDDLVDWIRANRQRPLSLTDLEERSHYSARHLQSLFRRRFACTPMQFVRRQRLALAWERLQAAAAGDSVTRIARDCGYRHLASFSHDIQRAYGCTPSSLLREGVGRPGPRRADLPPDRGGGGGQCDTAQVGTGGRRGRSFRRCRPAARVVITKLHKVIKVIERVLDGSAFLWAEPPQDPADQGGTAASLAAGFRQDGWVQLQPARPH